MISLTFGQRNTDLSIRDTERLGDTEIVASVGFKGDSARPDTVAVSSNEPRTAAERTELMRSRSPRWTRTSRSWDYGETPIMWNGHDGPLFDVDRAQVFRIITGPRAWPVERRVIDGNRDICRSAWYVGVPVL